MSDVAPFKGLASFEDSELDVRLFFGRERERELILANLMASRLTVLYGQSGVGKSSVLRAGVAHRLRELARESRERGREPELAVVVFDAWREDAVAQLDVFKRRIPNVLGNYLRLEHLDRGAGREAILGPIAEVNRLDGSEN